MIYIVIPAYNCEKTIKQCLDSLYCQTFSDNLIVAVDDGSTDNTLKILKSEQAKHKNLVVLKQKNQGPSAARNKGIDYVKSVCDIDRDFLVFVDADDWVEPDYLKSLYELVADNVGMTSCGFKWQKPTDKHIKNKKFKEISFTKKGGLEQLFVDQYIFVAPWNKLFSIKYLKDLKFNTNLNFGEDMLFSVEYVLALPKDATIKHTTKKLYHSIRNKNSLSARGFNEKKLLVLDVFDNIREKVFNVTGSKTYINAWEFLLLVEFTFYHWGRANKARHNELKSRARPLFKGYKKVRREYSSFRRLASYIFWCV